MVTSIDQPQRRLHRWLRAVVLVLTAGMVVAGCGGSEPEGLEAASPGPDAVVGGDVVDVQLFYEELISEFGGSVTDPDGQVLDAEFVVDSTIQATIVLAEPLDTPGDHTVRHEVVAVDHLFRCLGDDLANLCTLSAHVILSPALLVIAIREGAWRHTWNDRDGVLRHQRCPVRRARCGSGRPAGP